VGGALVAWGFFTDGYWETENIFMAYIEGRFISAIVLESVGKASTRSANLEFAC